MTPQFVDFNADGFTDIVTGTFDGSPHVSYGSADGFAQPSHILDRNGERMLMTQFWDYDAETWKGTDGPQCISAVAFDWDNDGDYDLLLGDYKEGLLFRRMNEGTNAKPRFSTKNTQVMIGDVPFTVEGGMSAPRLVDWNGDGLTDIVTGGMKKGGVFVYRNTGSLGAPEFAPPKTLIKYGVELNGPKFANNGCYPEVVDYDGDGDLDLLVGGYATWNADQGPLTDEQKSRIAELETQQETVMEQMMEITQGMQERMAEAETNEARQAISEELMNDEAYMKISSKYSEIWQELSKLQGAPTRDAGVWLYLRK